MAEQQWTVTVQRWPWCEGPEGRPVCRVEVATEHEAVETAEAALDNASRENPGVGFLAVWHDGEGVAWCKHRPATDEHPEGSG